LEEGIVVRFWIALLQPLVPPDQQAHEDFDFLQREIEANAHPLASGETDCGLLVRVTAIGIDAEAYGMYSVLPLFFTFSVSHLSGSKISGLSLCKVVVSRRREHLSRRTG
jgi:hypothetical protein